MTFRVGLLLALHLTACAAAEPPARFPPQPPATESPAWDVNADPELVALALGRACVEDGWLGRFRETHRRAPIVTVKSLHNRASAAIDGDQIARLIERELVRSGLVEVAARGPVDFVLTGTVDSAIDAAGPVSIVTYTTIVDLTSVSSDQRAWIGQKQLRKQREYTAALPAR